MSKTLPHPPFEIPLTDEQLILMGRIAVLWGQIDEGFNSILRGILKLDPKVFESVLGNQMIGSRVAHLKAAMHTARQPRSLALLPELVEKLTNVLPSRNAAMHGCWGRFPVDPTYTNYEVGIYNHQKPTTRFFANHLPRLYTDLVAIMDILGQLSMLSAEENCEPVMYDRNKIWFAPAPPHEGLDIGPVRGDRVIRVESTAPGWRQQ